MGKKLFATILAGLFLMTGVAFAEIADTHEADTTAQTATVVEEDTAVSEDDAATTPVVEKEDVTEEETTES